MPWFFFCYGGKVYQSYKAEGLNQFVKYFIEMKSSTLNDPLQEYYGAVHFNNVSLTNTVNSTGETEVNIYKSEPGVLGYSVGTGLIISIVKDYISIEASAGYTELTIEKLNPEEGRGFTGD